MSKNSFIFAALLAGCMTLTACQTAKTQETAFSEKIHAPKEANYQTVSVDFADYVKSAQGGAEIYYPVNVQLSPGKQVRFLACHVAEGDRVCKGDVLVSFAADSNELVLEEYELKLERAKQALEEGRANRRTAIQKAQKELDNLKVWDEEKQEYRYKKGARERQIMQLQIQKQEIDLQEFSYRSQQEIRDLEKQAAAILKNVESMQLTAPFDGVIDSVKILREGETVSANETVIEMYSEEKKLLAATGIVDDEIRCFSNVSIEVQDREEKKTFNGRVICAPNILPHDAQQGQVLIELQEEIGNAQDDILYYYDKQSISHILLTDRRAAGSDEQGEYVYVLEDCIVKKRYVVTGFSNSSQVWILDGLSAGQTLVLD